MKPLEYSVRMNTLKAPLVDCYFFFLGIFDINMFSSDTSCLQISRDKNIKNCLN